MYITRWTSIISIVTVGLLVSSAALAGGGGSINGKLEGKKKYLKNAVVYVDRVPGKHNPPAKPVILDQKNHQFVPAVLPIVQGTTVSFLNSDPEAHNVFSPDHEKYDLGNWTKGQHKEHKFTKLGVYTQLCRLHPSMIGYVLVLQNPYFAVASEDGSFTIPDVPPGKYELKVWQERGAGGPTPVTVKAGSETKVTIEVGKAHK